MLALVALGGCGSDAPKVKTYTTDRGGVFNDADVAFATDLIPHHAQALQLVDLTVGRELDSEIQALADQIRERRGLEIEELAGWLGSWDRPIPATARDHENAHSDDDSDSVLRADLPGMATAAELQELADSTGTAFEVRWLELMIQHHQGALSLAETERSTGVFKRAVRLAKSIETSLQREIDRMQELLRS